MTAGTRAREGVTKTKKIQGTVYQMKINAAFGFRQTESIFNYSNIRIVSANIIRIVEAKAVSPRSVAYDTTR